MTESRVKFGLTLPNRGVVIGATIVAEMLQLAADAESEGWDSVWVGDSIFAKPRLDAMVLLGAIAARTTRVRIGPACFASTPLRNALLLAYQWASLDFLSGGRTIFVACQGQAEPGGGAFEKEFAHFGIEPSSRMRRIEEAIEILRLASSRENVEYNGQYWRFRNLTVAAASYSAAYSHLGHLQPQSEQGTERRAGLPAGGAARRRLDDHLEVT